MSRRSFGNIYDILAPFRNSFIVLQSYSISLNYPNFTLKN